VRLLEMRPLLSTAVHESADFAELVCSNSLKSLALSRAAGSLKQELAIYGCQLLRWALQQRVPAGQALAVDRLAFSQSVTAALSAHPNISVERAEFRDLPALITSDSPSILASGPLTSDALQQQLVQALGAQQLAFFDAVAPIVAADSLDWSQLFSQSRYQAADGDYLNAALDRDQYQRLVEELVQGQRVILRDFENHELFSACQPVEEIARQGRDSLRYGALKPVGLRDPRTARRPWAVVQLRAENRNHTSYNLVGLQTNLTFAEQQRIFRLIPGLAEARFLRYGVMHRNTFINAPQLLRPDLAWAAHPQIHFAGQLMGTEGYMEAIAGGLVAALAVYAQLQGGDFQALPSPSLLGALLAYATDSSCLNYQPMHVNFGLIPALPQPVANRRQRYRQYSQRAAAAAQGYRRAHSELAWLPALPADFLIDDSQSEVPDD